MLAKKSTYLCFFIVYLLIIPYGFSINWFKKEGKKEITPPFYESINPVLWGKPLEKGHLKIFAIAPYFGSMDFLELEKRLDCSVQLVTTEDAFNIGCDPLWGEWCPDEKRKENIIQKIKNYLEKKWDLIIIAGIDLDILPRDIYQSVINNVAKGSGLVVIPIRSETANTPHYLEDFVKSLELNPEPVERWSYLFSGGENEMKAYLDSMPIMCAEYEKGRVVFIENYLAGVLNHVLLPEKTITGERTFYENGWAGLISLIFWCAHLTNHCKIVNILDAKPPGPVEEEIPPDLPMMVIQNLNQPLFVPGVNPFYIEIQRKEKQKIDSIKIQIRRENEYSFYQQYEFKSNLQKKGNSLTQVDLPVGAGNYFLDVWLLHKNMVLDFYTKRFSFSSWPQILSVETNKKVVFPNDSITLKIGISQSMLESRGGTIVAQGFDNYPYLPVSTESLICEHSRAITGKENEVILTLNFADLLGTYLKIKIWGVPFPIAQLGTYYSNLFSYHSLYIPIQRKIFKRDWKDFVQWKHIREYNQINLAKFYMDFFDSGSYLELEHYKTPGIITLYQPSIVQIAEEASKGAVSKNKREPCISDEEYVKKTKDNLTQLLNTVPFPTPYAMSLGLNNCLVQTEEWVCFCDECISKFFHFLQINEYTNILKLAENSLLSNSETINEIASKDGFPIYLSFYQKFMSDSFIHFETDLKNKAKTLFPDIPIGYRYYNKGGIESGIDWIETGNVMDWVVLEPEPFSYSIIPYIKSKGKSFWMYIDFANPQLTAEKIQWIFWNSILNQANGVWFLNINGDIYNSLPIKLFSNKGNLSSDLMPLIDTVKTANYGIREVFANLTPDYNEEIGIYYSPENLFITMHYPEFSYKNAFTHFIRLINGFSINPIIVTKENILQKDKLKVLIFPCCLWLSEEEMEKLSEYLERGIIVADITPGIIDSNNLSNNLRDIFNNLDIRNSKIKNDNIFILDENVFASIENTPIENIKKEIILLNEILSKQGIQSPYINKDGWIDGRLYSYNNGEVVAWQANLNPLKINEKIYINLQNNKNKHIRNVLEEKIKSKKKICLNIHQKEPVILCSYPNTKMNMDITVLKNVLRGTRYKVSM